MERKIERMPKNKCEKYWYINDQTLEPYQEYYFYELFAERRIKSGNIFNTKKEAESMARKLRAVLNGAEVIEKPNEAENRVLKAVCWEFPLFKKFLESKLVK